MTLIPSHNQEVADWGFELAPRIPAAAERHGVVGGIARAHKHALGTPPEEVARGAGQVPAPRGSAGSLQGLRPSAPASPAMEAEPPLYPVAGAAGPQGDEDRLGVPDGPEAPVSGDGDGDGVGARGPGSPPREGMRPRAGVLGTAGRRGRV